MPPRIATPPRRSSRSSKAAGEVRTGLGPAAITRALTDNLHYLQAKLPQHATRNDWYMALAYTVRERMLDRYIDTVDAIAAPGSSSKVVAYLSAEFLLGPHLGNNLVNLGIEAAARHHYGTSASSLSRTQASRLAAVLPNPLERDPDQMGGTASRIRTRMGQMGW